MQRRRDYHPHIDSYMDDIRTGKIPACKELHQAMDYIESKLGHPDVVMFQPTHPHGVRQWKEKLRFYVRLSTRSREPLWKERQQNLAIKQKRVKALLKLFCEFLWKTKIT